MAISQIPAATAISGTLPVANGGTGTSTAPCFSAYANALQSITTQTTTLVNFGAKDWDTASCYDTSTSKFTPNVAGYYQVNGAINASTTWTKAYLAVYKNGSVYKYGTDISTSTFINTVQFNSLVYMNGTTDYIQLYCAVTGSSPQIYGGQAPYTWFQAALVRTS